MTSGVSGPIFYFPTTLGFRVVVVFFSFITTHIYYTKIKTLAQFISCPVNQLLKWLNCVSCKINYQQFLYEYMYFKIPL